MTPWLSIVGIGEDGWDGLSAAGRALIATAATLIGGERHLALVPAGTAGTAERLRWRQPFADSFADIAARRGTRVAVLASGDPLWYGVAVALRRHFTAGEMTILPQPSAFSLAAARLGWPLAECVALSLHGRPLDGLRLHLAPQARLLLLSKDRTTPSLVAALLTEAGWGPSRLSVFAHLGGASETATSGTAAGWGEQSVADLNTIALECVATPRARPLPLLAGLPDAAFLHDGQLTKREVRAATLARLAPLPGELLWDIGAGSGAVAIEWLRASRGGGAVAVERDAGRAATIARNAAALGVPQLVIVPGAAPAALQRINPPLLPPDAVFVGGGIAGDGIAGGGFAGGALLPALWAALRPGGRLVANAVTIAGEMALFDWQARHGGELTRIAVSRAEPLGGHQVWRPQLSVTQLAATKPL